MALKQIFAPHLGRKVKMGRTHPVALGPRLSLKKYLKRLGLPAAPAQVDYSKPAMPVLNLIYLNDQLGDCVIAAGYHQVGLETGNAGDLFQATDNQIIADYSAIGGYDPKNPKATDNGCDEVTALNYWCEHGFADQTKGLGWLAVDPTNQQEIMAAMYLFENLFFAMDLPDQWVNPMPAASGFVWDVAGDPVVANGHAVAGAGYNQSGVTIDSWGLLGTLTWKAIAKYCTKASGGGLYVMLTPDELAKGQTKAPNSVANGVDWTALIQDFNSLGANPPIPVPTPTPTPTTAPVITSPKSATATVNKNFSYKISATNNPTGFAASGLPAGFSVNASSGVISGTPKAPGSCKITVSAKNAKGIGSATIALTIVKTPAPTPPPATPPPPGQWPPPAEFGRNPIQVGASPGLHCSAAASSAATAAAIA